MYKSVIRPCLFRIDAERIHGYIVKGLHIYRHIYPMRCIIRGLSTPDSNMFVWRNIKFTNRVGLSAGFDKEASCFDELADFGFGFLEVGTVTPSAVKGNPCPRIFRLVNDNALISRTGFNNPGKDVFLKNLSRKKKGRYVLGININTNTPDSKDKAKEDITLLYNTYADYADYYTINWGSIPPEVMAEVLDSLEPLRKIKDIPVLLKLPADIPFDKLDNVIEFAKLHGINGFIASGPTQDRTLLSKSTTEEVEKIGAGGISGAPVFKKSVKLVEYLSSRISNDMLLIGAGGVMNEKDAQTMIKAGADLVQTYSAFIFEGPSVIKRMAVSCN